MPTTTNRDADLDRIRAQRIEELRRAGQPHPHQAPEGGHDTRAPCQAPGCGLAPSADVHQGATPPVSKREQDALKRKTAKGPPAPHWAAVAVLGDPAGRLDVQVGPGSLPCEAVTIERTMVGAWLVLRIPLAHASIHLRKAPATAKIVAEEDDGAPDTNQEHEAQPSSAAGVVPEAQPNGAPSVANAMDAAIQEGIVLPAKA